MCKQSMYSYRTLVWFFPSMPPHVDHQHVLRLKGFLFSRAFLPPTHKLLLLPVDVVIVDVLENKMNKIHFWNHIQNLSIQFLCVDQWSKYYSHSFYFFLAQMRGGEGSIVSLSVRFEQDFQIKPCHFTSHRALAPLWQALTVVLPWQLPIWGLRRRRRGGRRAREGRQIQSSVGESENAGALRLQPSILSVSATFLFILYLHRFV